MENKLSVLYFRLGQANQKIIDALDDLESLYNCDARYLGTYKPIIKSIINGLEEVEHLMGPELIEEIERI